MSSIKQLAEEEANKGENEKCFHIFCIALRI